MTWEGGGLGVLVSVSFCLASSSVFMPKPSEFQLQVCIWLFNFFFKILCVWVFCLKVYLCIMWVQCPRRPEDGIRSCWAGL